MKLTGGGVHRLDAEGEGSQGGRVIGHTSSGKPIYYSHVNHKQLHAGFTIQEHREAAQLHGGFAIGKSKGEALQHYKLQKLHNTHASRMEGAKNRQPAGPYHGMPGLKHIKR